MKNRKNFKPILVLSLVLLLASAAVYAIPGLGNASEGKAFPNELFPQRYESALFEEGFNDVPLSDKPAFSSLLLPEASGVTVYSNTHAAIDASNTADGYVMIRYAGASKSRLKVIITGSSKVNYTYNLNTAGEYEVFPLSDGSGEYSFGVYQNTSGNKYATLFSQKISATLKDEFAPFLLPNQYVNYHEDSLAVAKAAELTAACEAELEKVEEIYKHVIGSLSYDKEKAATVKSGYLPDVDEVLSTGKGICFDYSALMAAMLRSQGIPTKLVIGYTGDIYHAWLNVYTEETGWVEGIVFFDGTTWKLMDPTFASSASGSGKKSEKIMEYIGNGSNYSAKYLY